MTNDVTLPGELTTTRATDLAAEASDAAPPETIGSFIVEGMLGAGAMGVVMRARDPELQRTVAIKLLTPRYGDDARARSRLLREAQSVAQLSHPNVVAVHQVGVLEGRVYVVMEYVDGGTLRGWIAEQPRTWSEVVEVYRQAAHGLAAAHAVGFVHRDFKPDNVLIGSDGRVRVSDFGLVRAGPEDLDTGEHHEGDVRLTQTGALLGTPAYMAPEQFSGADVGPEADQFAFCVALFEALHGTRPFKGSTASELLVAMESGKREPPTNDDVPETINRALERGLALDPRKRHVSLKALIRALSPAPRTRRPWLLLGAATTAIAGLVAVGVTSQDEGDNPYPCVATGPTVPAAWNDDALDRLSAALTEAGFAEPGPIVGKADATAHAYGAELWRVRNSLCTTLGARPEDLARQQHCLRLRTDTLAQAVDTLAEASPAIARQAIPILTELPPADVCLDAAALEARESPPADAVYAQRRELLRAAAAFGRGDDETAETIAGEVLAAAEDGVTQAHARRVLGLVALNAYDLAAAEKQTRAAIAAAREAKDAATEWRSLLLLARILGERPEDRKKIPALADAANDRATAVGERGDFDFEFSTALALRHKDLPKAQTHAQAAVDSALGRSPPAPRLTIDALSLREALRFAENRLQPLAKIEDLRSALEISERELGPEHPQTAGVKAQLALRLGLGLQFAASLAMFEDAAQLLDADIGDNRERRAMVRLRQANIYTNMGQPGPAAEAAREALEVFKDRPDRIRQQIGAHSQLGAAHFLAGDAEAADTALGQASLLAQRFAGTGAVDWMGLLHTWGGAKMLKGDYEGMRLLAERAKDWLEDKHGVAGIEIVLAYVHIGDALLLLRRCDEAIAAYTRSQRIRLDLELEPDDHQLRSIIGKAICHAINGDAEAAEDSRAQVKELLADGSDPYKVYAQWMQMIDVELKWHRGDRAGARELAKAAAAASRARGVRFRPYTAAIEQWLEAHSGVE